MKANRYMAAIVGAALAISFVLPGAVWAQDDDKWRNAFSSFQRGDYAQAETQFREVCTYYEDQGQPWGWCHMMLGTTLAASGVVSKRQEALAQLEIAKELVANDGERYMTHNGIAQIHLVSRNWAGAIDSANDARAFANAEQQGVLAKTKGQAYYNLQDFASAARELAIAVTTRCNEANLFAQLGHSYFELNEKEKALPQLMKAAQLDRNNRIGLFFAARIHLDDGNFEQAIALAERAIQAHPQDTSIRDILGTAYLGEDRFQEAEQQFLVVLQDRPNKQLTIYNLAQAYTAMKDWPRAIEQYQKAQNLFAAGSPMQARLLYDLGVAFETISRNEDALRAYKDSAAISENVDKTDAIERVEERIRRAKGKGKGGSG